MTDTEQVRLQKAHENSEPWYRWGPYLSERQWGTVREDYSADGDAWDYFPHDHARCVLTVGEKMGCWECVMIKGYCALLLHSGTRLIQF